jgi:hypothetical protein
MACNYRLHEQICSDENSTKKSTIYRYGESGLLLSTITISGDSSKAIDEEKFGYGENGLLCSSENNQFLYNYEYDGLNNLKKWLYFNKKTKRRSYMTFEYKEKQKIKQSKYYSYSTEDVLKYELTFKYDDMGSRIAIFSDNEFFGYREYDDNGLFRNYHMKTGETVHFIWENKYSSFDWNMFYGF